jgi:phage portal protein BeeE
MGLSFKATQQTNHDLEFIEGKKLTRDEILINFRIGLEMFGKTESKTRANAEASIFVFTRFVVLPFLENITDVLTNHYLREFPGTEDMEFTFDDPVPQNDENKRAIAETLFKTGAITPDEIRQMFNLDPLNLPGTKVPYTTIQSIPLSEDAAPAAQEKPGKSPGKDDAEKPADAEKEPPKGESKDKQNTGK